MADFESYRPLLFSIAYRMLGSAAEAEDLVQDAYVRYASADASSVRDVKAFLATIVTRLALDRLKSAQKQREEYVGEWLPEPVFTGGDADPFGRAAREETIGLALTAALERLAPQERAVMLLSEVLDYDHNEIAELLDISAASSRQILHRARERVASERPRFRPSREEQERLINGFLAAARDGDVDGLRQILASDVVARGDGGGRVVGAGIRPVVGLENVTRLWIGVARKMPPGLVIQLQDVNGAPGIVGTVNGSIFTVMSFVIEEGRIKRIDSVLNPDKLKFAQKQGVTAHSSR